MRFTDKVRGLKEVFPGFVDSHNYCIRLAASGSPNLRRDAVWCIRLRDDGSDRVVKHLGSYVQSQFSQPHWTVPATSEVTRAGTPTVPGYFPISCLRFSLNSFFC
jgi:hypothetical protein